MNFKPVIVAVAYNRAHSLKRLLGSLHKAHYPEDVKLIISIDRGENNQDVLAVANEFHWEYGEKEVIYQPENLGLRPHILKCGDFSQEYGSVIILEDDLYVSPYFYHYATEALNFYGEDEEVGGIGLYRPRLNGNAKKLPFFPMFDGSDVFFAQMVCSWGEAWSKLHWKLFRDWLAKGQEVTATDKLPANIKRWKAHSWVKIFSKYVVEYERYFVYPQISYTTNMGDVGVHFDKQEADFQVTLQMGKTTPRFRKLEDALNVYDICMDILPSRINRLKPEMAEYDYVVDFYGSKPLELYDEPYVLTQSPVSKSIMSFGRSLVPFEMNVIEGVEGKDLHLARKEDILPYPVGKPNIYEFFYSHIPLRPLVGLTSIKLKEKKPFSLFF